MSDTSGSKLKILAKAFALVFGLVALACNILHNDYFTSYSKNGCRAVTPPDCIVEINNHGIVSYISQKQSETLNELLALVGAFAFAAIFLWLYASYPKIFKKRPD